MTLAYDALFIGGQWVPSAENKTITVVSASTEEVLGRVPEATEADIDAAVAAARTAFDDPAGWSRWEALESCQDGFTSGGIEWNDISRGMTREPKATDEEQMRAFWRQWREQVSSHREVVA
ncbi:aldehyde dehydrogenase family protein [Williamsia sp.]|uniref:aldehyde dehydrogenase family protein n=1 Tax=Williamsia sp. TaxID=1872085 RepID=UPI0039C8DF2E